MRSPYCFTKSTFWKAFGLYCLLGCLSSAGISPIISTVQAAEPPSEAGPEQAPEPPEESTEEPAEGDNPSTSDEVMYRVFSGEVLGADGDLKKSAAEYLAAALESDDPDISERATAIAVAAEAWQYAAMAADRWVMLSPDNPAARQTATRALLMTGDYVGAEHQMSELLAMSQDEEWGGWKAVAGLLTVSFHPEQTSKTLEYLVETTDAAENPYVLLARSQMAARLNNQNGARGFAAQAVNKAPGEVELQAWAGQLALNAGDAGSASQYFSAARELEPENRDLARMYANLLRSQGRGEQANAVLADLPDDPDMRFIRIAFALESGDRALAESLFNEFGSAQYEDRSEAAFQAGRSAELLQMPQQAIDWYAQVSVSNRYLLATIRHAVLLVGLDQMDEARKVLTQARQNADPFIRLEVLVAESQLLLEANMPEEAMGILDQALESDPDDTRLLYTRSLVAVDLDRLEMAERDLRIVLQAEPDNAAALNALGYTLADRTDRFDEAEQLIRQAFALQPDEASIIDSMGWIAFRQGRLNEAEAFLREAFGRDQNAEIAAHLGEVLWMMGRQQEARMVWQQGWKIDENNRVLIETLQRMGVPL